MKVTIASAEVPVTCFILTCKRAFNFEYSMVIFPQKALSGNITQAGVTPSTDPSTRTAKYTQAQTADATGNNGKNWKPWATPVVAADAGYKIVKVEVTGGINTTQAKGNPCQFIQIDPHALEPQNMGASAQVTGRNNSYPCQLQFTVWEEKAIAVPHPLPSLPVDFAPGETKPVKVSGDAVSVLMNLTSATGNKYVVQVVPAGGVVVSAPVTCTSRTDVGGGFAQYLCTAQPVDFY